VKIRTTLLSILHRLAYLTSIFLPLPRMWEKLHSRDYHPNVEGIIERIISQRALSSPSLFARLGEQLDFYFDLKDKSVLEIGHGGGWYLAEALDAGAKTVSGIEISEEINKRAKTALEKLDYGNFHLFLGNGKDLSVVRGSTFDLIFTITVLQHMPTRITKKYLRDIRGLLAPGGICMIQTLNSYGSSMKRLSAADLFSVAYSKSEFDGLLAISGLQTIEYVSQDYGSDETYWGIYLVKTAVVSP